MMDKRCDLHTHSNYSDGSLTPLELVRLAEKQGLSALALTDHNTARGLKEFMEAGRNSDIITVAGCEFSTEWHEKEVHIVGLFFQEKDWVEIEDFLKLPLIAKHNSNLSLIDNLQKAGYDVTYEECAAMTDGQEFNRAHVARSLVSKAYFATVADCFDTVLKDGGDFYHHAKKTSSTAAIRFIREYGAVAILAHPFLSLTYEELLEFLPEAKDAGLAAIETRYTEFTPEETELAVSLAERFDLKQSGGSDFHGAAKPDIALGTGHGDLIVPFAFYEDLLSSAVRK